MHPLIKPLTASILILALLSAGCTDMGGGSVERSTPDSTSTAEPTQEPTATPIESQHLYDIKPDTFDYIKIDRDNNLFSIEIEGSKVFDDISGWETVYDDNENRIFQRETYTPSNFDLYRELQPEQARALEEKYGYPVKLTREDADLNPKGDGQLDIVRIKYEGTKGSFIYESNIPKKGTTRLIEDFLNSK